ncbi:MAG: FAD-binding oxidoreductase [Bacteroidia bacterium]
MKKTTTNWGKYPVAEGPLISFREGMKPVESHWITRGMGRCYGDSSLGETMFSSLKMNRFLAFDPEAGILTCESGVTYEDILETFVPKGWFPPVTPGTKFVSMGGALASDVHGKNHHREGSISRYISSFDLLLHDGRIITCSRQQNADIFYATAGGMGLTGMILRLTIQLKRIETSAIRMDSVKAANLEEILGMFDRFEADTYSMAWIDCLSGGKRVGRSIMMKGEHASQAEVTGTAWEKTPLSIPKKLKLTVPFDFPGFVLNRFSIQAFNTLYYHKQLRKERRIITDYDTFFYPLDAIHHWNRIYGKRGFTQYQLVIPKAAGEKGIKLILDTLRQAGMGSFLAVLKLLGNSEGLISFPMEGYTLTLDFPIEQRLFPFLDRLDQIVMDFGGRIYLTKDVRMPAEVFAKTYPALPEFRRIVRALDPEGRVRSLQSERLGV